MTSESKQTVFALFVGPFQFSADFWWEYDAMTVPNIIKKGEIETNDENCDNNKI